MTGPGTGHPDWQSYANWRGMLFSVDSVTVPTTGTDFGLFVTTNFAGLYVNAVCATGFGSLILSWYADTDGAELVQVDSYPMGPDTALEVIIPARGNAVDVFFDVQSPGSAILSLTVLPTNIAVGHTTFLTGPNWITDLNVSVAHSTAHTVNPVPIVGGPAYVSFVPHDSAAKLTLDIFGLDNDGTKLVRVANYNLPAATVQAELIVPPLPLQYVVTNTDTVSAHVYDLGIILRTQ